MPRSSRLRRALLILGVAALASGCSEAQPLATLSFAPTPLPTAKPGEVAAKAFFDRVASGTLTYHAAFTGRIVGPFTALPIDGQLDVAGDDYSEAITYTFPNPPKVVVDARAVGSGRWVRVDRGRWEKASSSMASNSPFAGLASQDDVRLAQTEHVGGKDLHHLVMDGALIVAPDQIPAPNVTNERVEKTSLEIVVDPAGTPLTGTWKLDGEARVSGQVQSLRMTIDMTFTKVDSKIVIKAP